MTEFSSAAKARLHSREIVDLLDLALTHSTEATLISLSDSLVCSRLPDVARLDAGALVLHYAAGRDLCPSLEIQRAVLLAQSDETEKGIKPLTSVCPHSLAQNPVENATARLLQFSMVTGDFETTSLALRNIGSREDNAVPCKIESSFVSVRSSADQISTMPIGQVSRLDGRYTGVSLLDLIASPKGTISVSEVRTLFLNDPAAFTSHINETCALIGGIKPINEAAASSNRDIHLNSLLPGCYVLSASVPLTLVGGHEPESAAGVIIILRRGQFRLIETSKSGAIVLAPKLGNAAAAAPRIYGFPVYFYIGGSNERPKEVFAFHWVSGIPRLEDGAYIQAKVQLIQKESLVYLEQSTAAIAALLSKDDMSEIRLDLAGPALGVSIGGIYGTPLRILQSKREVCTRIKNAHEQGLTVTVPANWDEALTLSDRADRAKFCLAGNTVQCFAKLMTELDCRDDTDDNNPFPSLLSANVTKFRLGHLR